MKPSKDIKPVTHLKTRAAELLRDVKRSRRPVVITQQGEAQAVLLDVATYEAMRDAILLQQLTAQGEADAQAGRTVPQAEAFARLRRKRKQGRGECASASRFIIMSKPRMASSLVPSASALLLLGALAFCGCVPRLTRLAADSSPTDTTPDTVAAAPEGSGDPARLLSAFFGLDNSLPSGANEVICSGAASLDGMPVVFSHQIHVATVQAGDFRVVTRSGKVGRVHCVTMAPAADPGELRTALLAGEFGDAATDPPARVEIVGNLLSADDTRNFKGASVEVTPLPAGPTLVWIELAPPGEWKLGDRQSWWGRGSGCPETTSLAVRATWSGGVRRPDGTEAGESERALYRVTLERGAEGTVEVVPFALGDLGDGDNNHLLCLQAEGLLRSVSFPAGHLVDPNDDLNPPTEITIDPHVKPSTTLSD